jgi:hypothetical protein
MTLSESDGTTEIRTRNDLEDAPEHSIQSLWVSRLAAPLRDADYVGRARRQCWDLLCKAKVTR